MATEQELEETPGAVDPNVGAPAETEQRTVDLDDDDEPAGEAEAAADKKSRRSWKREMREQLKQTQTQKAETERQLNELRAELAGMRGAMARPAPAQYQQQDHIDPVDRDLEALQDQKDAIIVQLRSDGITDSQVEKLRKQYRDIEKKMFKVAGQRPERQERGEDPAVTENRMLQAEFPEVFGDEVRLQEAKTELLRLMRANRQPASYALAKQAAKIVADRYNRKPPAPSNADRARHTSVPGRAGGSPGSQVAWPPPKVQLNAARAYTQHRDDLTDEQRYKIWAKGPGKKLGLTK